MDNLRLFNSLTRQKELFKPRVAGKVEMYVCGMTVDNYCHIGHARVMVVFDMIARHLRALGFELTYVRNITDVDDKIIALSNKNNEDIQSITQRFIQAMHEDEAALGCLSPTHEPRAVDAIGEMIAMIEALIEKNHAYQAENGDVYYAVRSFAQYGKLSNRQLDELRAGERVAVNQAKRDALDFVLWKSAKPDEPSWDSPWGKGRPGWHIECSAMSRSVLGEAFDIHGGGMDLKFPHHECEIAQSEPVCGGKHVNYWLHNGFVTIDSEKMSKSLGNFFTVRDVLAKYDGEVLRFFILSSHYRGPINYSDAALEEARRALRRLYVALEHQDIEHSKAVEFKTEFVARFNQAMNDDFNTPQAIAVLFDLVKALNKAQAQERADLLHTLRSLAGRLGLLERDKSVTLQKDSQRMSADEIQAHIQRRNHAKQQRDFASADAIRAELLEAGVAIKDTPDGVVWEYV